MKRVISDAKRKARLSGDLKTLTLLEKLEPGLVEEAEQEEKQNRLARFQPEHGRSKLQPLRRPGRRAPDRPQKPSASRA
jgi:hypothetical protein